MFSVPDFIGFACRQIGRDVIISQIDALFNHMAQPFFFPPKTYRKKYRRTVVSILKTV